MSKISVIIPKSQEAELTAMWAESQLEDIDHEVIIAKNWGYGLETARGDYVCLLEKDCFLAPEYFAPLLDTFENNPLFRKLAMVAPAVGVNSMTNRIYGYKIAMSDAYPSFASSSISPYLIQTAYIPGALIRKSAVRDLQITEKDLVLNSLNFCISLWGDGQRILLNPVSLYVSSDSRLDIPFSFYTPHEGLENAREVLDLFRREQIG